MFESLFHGSPAPKRDPIVYVFAPGPKHLSHCSFIHLINMKDRLVPNPEQLKNVLGFENAEPMLGGEALPLLLAHLVSRSRGATFYMAL